MVVVLGWGCWCWDVDIHSSVISVTWDGGVGDAGKGMLAVLGWGCPWAKDQEVALTDHQQSAL